MNTSAELIEDIRNGKMVILIDDEDRENEGDIVMASDFVTPDAINFMATEARGLICLSLTESQVSRLGVPPMIHQNKNYSPNKTAFMVSIEAAEGVSTGISAADRSHTIRVASNPQATTRDIIMPGHIFPIQAQEGGVLKRAGHTEASMDMARMAGLNPAAVICEIMNPDGSMARTSELLAFAKKHDLKIGTIEDLIEYRIENETFVSEVARAPFETNMGTGFEVRAFKNELDGKEHLAFVKGKVSEESPTLVRVHSEFILGDVFGSQLHDTRAAIEKSLKLIEEHGSGILVYLKMEDMEHRLVNRIHAMDQWSDKDSAETRAKVFRSDKKDYGVGAQILRSLGVRQLNLITNSSAKRVGLKGYGLEVVETTPFEAVSHSNILGVEEQDSV